MGKLLKGITSGDSITNIYNDYNPAYKNLYTVEIYYVKKGNWADDDTLSNYIRFHAVDVSFPDEMLNLDRNKVTKNFQLKSEDSFTRAEKLSITWRESDDWRVKKFHQNWLANIYNKDKDFYYSYPRIDEQGNELDTNTLYRKIKIILPYSKLSGTDYQSNTIVFENVLPSNIGKFDFSWNSTSEIVTHTIDYYVKSWSWEDSDTLPYEEKKDEVNGEIE